MGDFSAGKSDRLLVIYSQLVGGAILTKRELAQRFQVTEKSIQRDMDALRCFFAEQALNQDVIYDPKAKGYRLIDTMPQKLSNSEILAVCKILLESRSLRKDEMLPILDKLITCCVPEQNKAAVDQLIANEKFHYIEPHHGKPILERLWDIGQAIQGHQVMEIQYERMKEPKLVTRRIEPVGIMFSEYYFYLTAFLQDVDREAEFEKPDDLFPTIYRIDRIASFRILSEHFRVPYSTRFEEGEFRKRVQFMYGGKLERIRFRYTGPSLEAVLDRLPTARIVEKADEGYIIEAEVFGKGIEMWMRGQGKYIAKIEKGADVLP